MGWLLDRTLGATPCIKVAHALGLDNPQLHNTIAQQDRELKRLDPLGRLGCLSVIRLPQSSACQRSLVEVRPIIPVYTLVDQSVFVLGWDCPVHQTLSAVPQ